MDEIEMMRALRASQSGQGEKVRNECKNEFIEDSRYAKIVQTGSGDAILIAGCVIEIKCKNQSFVVDALVSALRRGSVSTESGSTEAA